MSRLKLSDPAINDEPCGKLFLAAEHWRNRVDELTAERDKLKEQVMDWSCKYHDKVVERDKLREDVKVLQDAIRNHRDVKGRFHTEQATYRLYEALKQTEQM